MPSSEQNSQNYEFLNDPLYLSPSDQPNLILINTKLTDQNYIYWKREAYLALISKNKDGFVDGTVEKPDKKDKTYHQWIRCDIIVTSWLKNSIEQNIKDTVNYISSARDLWKELHESMKRKKNLLHLKNPLITWKKETHVRKALPLLMIYTILKWIHK
ncbi:unnamed protein product [Cuscuta epithymum]|uniref:Retrotransposon Copia-like N-terminal domain-containing protein n=1 Tax=Cuscuta epithymum TaxID=186058 RepID=A0AAV0F5W0_9ASTE|nr:unnamed protein product [Cuscuta epithymum]